MTLLLSSLANTLIIIGALFIAFIVIFVLIKRKSSSSWSTLREPLEIEPPPSIIIDADSFIPTQFFSESCYIFMFLWTDFKRLLTDKEITVPAFEVEEVESMPHFGTIEDDAYIFTQNEALSLAKSLLERFHRGETSPVGLNTEITYYIFFGENKYNMASIKLEYSDNCPGYGWTLEKETGAARRGSNSITFRKKVSEKIVEEKSIT